MPNLDVFTADPFREIEMTDAVNMMEYIPGLLGEIPGLFEPVPVRTTGVWIESRANGPAKIQTDRRGDPPKARGGLDREARMFPTVRIAERSRINAHELQDIRPFGRGDSELMSVMEEVSARQALIMQDVQLTMENLRLGCVQGIVVDADDSVLFDWPTEFSQAIPAEVDFDLDAATPASGVVRKTCNGIVRSVLRGLKGLGGNRVRIVGLAGDTFWDDLTAHAEVRETYLNQAGAAAASLREGDAFQELSYGGIRFINYRGTDDGSTVAVGTDKCKFFPTNAGIFKMAYAPAETFTFVNTRGRALYSWIVTDKDRNAWADVEMYSYPLPVCTMPQALHRAKRT